MSETKFFAPDTNFFLQFKDPRELPWGELGDWSTVRLIILETVLDELDNLKDGPNNRRTRRARKLNRKIRGLVQDEQEELVLLERAPRVVLQFGPELAYDREPHPALNYRKADHQIIDEALATGQQMEGLTFLTGDNGAARKARSIGLEVQMPPEEWRLPPEPDEGQRRIQELERRVDALTTQAPILTVELIQDGKAVSAFRGTITRYRPTTEHFRARVMEAISEKFPAHNARYLVGYSDKRTRWEDRIEKQLKAHWRIAEMLKGLKKLSLAFANQGTVTAEGLEIEVDLEGDMLLVDEKELARLHGGDLKYPMPPSPPSYADLGFRAPVFNHTLPDLRTNPRKLYWSVDEPALGSKSARGRCADFRHQDGSVERHLLLSGLKDQQASQVNGQLIVRMSAKNLPEPVVKRFPIHINFLWVEADEDARLQLAEDLDVHLPA